jgi:hypothetical protein
VESVLAANTFSSNILSFTSFPLVLSCFGSRHLSARKSIISDAMITPHTTISAIAIIKGYHYSLGPDG